MQKIFELSFWKDKYEFYLTLIWVGILGFRFPVMVGEGGGVNSKTR